MIFWVVMQCSLICGSVFTGYDPQCCLGRPVKRWQDSVSTAQNKQSRPNTGKDDDCDDNMTVIIIMVLIMQVTNKTPQIQ
jgi:hypothetical protein